jgi:hypothetical protein
MGAGATMPGSLALATPVRAAPALDLFVASQARLTETFVSEPNGAPQVCLTETGVSWPNLNVLLERSADSLSLTKTYAHIKGAIENLKESGTTATRALYAPWSENILHPNTYSFKLLHECWHYSIDVAPCLQPANDWWTQPTCPFSATRTPSLPETSCDPLARLWRPYRGDNADVPDLELREIIEAAPEQSGGTYILVLLSNALALAAAELASKACLALLMLRRRAVSTVLARAWISPTSVAAIIRTLMSHRHRHEPADGRLLPQAIFLTRWRAAIVR